MSPGAQSSASQIAARVEKRTAVTLLFLILDRFTLVMPTFSASSFSDIFRSTIIRSSRSTILPTSTPPYSRPSVSVSSSTPRAKTRDRHSTTRPTSSSLRFTLTSAASWPKSSRAMTLRVSPTRGTAKRKQPISRTMRTLSGVKGVEPSEPLRMR